MDGGGRLQESMLESLDSACAGRRALLVWLAVATWARGLKLKQRLNSSGARRANMRNDLFDR